LITRNTAMDRARLEAFSDAVIAIIITIMVLELRVPQGGSATLAALEPLVSVFLSYVLSFIFLGLYWNNHHHLLKTVKVIDGGILWANLHLLFWLSLVPFTTAWMGEHDFAAWPVALYGIVLLSAGAAYFILTHTLMDRHGRSSVLAQAIGADYKGKASILLYAIAIPLAFKSPPLSCAIYVVVAIMWLIPDRRIERVIENQERK
jgi:uncharacterized membrane protein